MQTLRELDLAGELLGDLSAAASVYLPRAAAALLILTVGWLLARLLELVLARALRNLRFDALVTRSRIFGAFQREGATSRWAGRALFWLVLIVALLLAVESLQLEAASAALRTLVGYVPNVLGATSVALVGLLVARFARNLAASAALAGGLDQSERVGTVAARLVWLLFAIVASQQLGLQADLVVVVAGVALATFAVSFGIAFSLGAAPVIRHILAGHFLRQNLAPGRSISVNGKRGIVERVGPVDTLLRDGEELWMVPNGRLLEEVVSF